MMNLSNMDRGGLVLGMSRDRSRLYCNTDDTHTLIIGATRSGKSRNVVLPSICTMALAGESMVVVDPKAELYLYTYPYLERLGYEVVAIDFKEPLKSNRYNFLQPVIDAINMGDNALAVTRARDMVTGNPERAVKALESRVASPKLGQVTRGLIAVLRGDDQRIYFDMLAAEFRKSQNEEVEKELLKRPSKLNPYMGLLFVCMCLMIAASLGTYMVQQMTAYF